MMRIPYSLAVAIVILLGPIALAEETTKESGQDAVQRNMLLPSRPGHPRNSEGDFIQVKDGRVLLVYRHFTGGAGDHSTAHLAGRFSSDGGRTWSDDDVVVVPHEEGNRNVMSVSLLRLKSGPIALFYMRKSEVADPNSLEGRVLMRTSTDEAQTWSEPTEVFPPGEFLYCVLNNDRVVQLKSGRLIVPVAQHNGEGSKAYSSYGRPVCYYSDDEGRSWKRGKPLEPVTRPDAPKQPVMHQEPGVVELKDGRLMMFCRTNAGSQYISYSTDEGETWSESRPSGIKSPLSPASIERIPSTGDLLLVWNDHSNIPTELRGKRTPYNAAISRDEGESWEQVKTLEDNPHGWYCYTAIAFVDDHVLLAHCAGDRRETNGLADTQVTRFPVSWLYE